MVVNLTNTCVSVCDSGKFEIIFFHVNSFIYSTIFPDAAQKYVIKKMCTKMYPMNETVTLENPY